MSASVFHHYYYSSGNHPTFCGVRSETCSSKMSEHITESKLGDGGALSSFSKMMGRGEGIYASAMSADVGLQHRDQIGLTLPPKAISGVKLSLDACMITGLDFEDALMQLEPLLAEAEGLTSSPRANRLHGSCRRYIAPSLKRRKLSRGFFEPWFEKQSSSPVICPKSPALNKALPVSVNNCAENPNHDDGNENLCYKRSELPSLPPNNSQERIQACQENERNVHRSTHRRVESVEESDQELVASKSSHHVPTKSCEITTAGSESAVLEMNLRGTAMRLENGQGSDTVNDGAVNGEPARVASLCHGEVFWGPDVPLQSIEEEAQGTAADHAADMRSSRCCHFDDGAMHGVSAGLNAAVGLTIAGVTELAANGTTQKSDTSQDTSQDSLQPLRGSSQTSTLASVARLFLQNLQQALFEGYFESLSTHQIPAELRARFEALLKRYHSDEQFQRAVGAFTMEVIGAVRPGESDPVLIPLKLRQALEIVYKKYRTEDGFRMSLDKFIIEFLKEKKASENLSSGVIEPDDDILGEKRTTTDLDGLSTEQLIAYCRELETSRAEHMKNYYSVKDQARRLSLKLQGKPRVGQHPAERSPDPGVWTCFHPKIPGKNKKEGPCARSNPYYESKLVWKEVTHCRTCKGPYHEDFRLLKLKTPKKWYPQSKHKANEAATLAAYQPPENPQVNYHRASSSTQMVPLLGASSGQIYGHLGEDEHINGHHSTPDWIPIVDKYHHNPSSETFLPNLMSESFSGVNDSTACGPLGFRNSNIEITNSLHLNTDLNAQGGEFDEFAIDSDSLFADEDMDMDPGLQRTSSFLEETNTFMDDFQQFENGPEAYDSHYPDRVNLFPQNLDPLLQSNAMPSLPQHHSEIGNSNYGLSYAFASSSNQQHEPSRNRAPTQLNPSYRPYQSPYGPIDPSAPMQSAKFGDGFPAIDRLQIPNFGGMAPLNSTVKFQPDMHTSQSTSLTHHPTTKTGSASTITDADYSDVATAGRAETLEPLSWPSHSTPVKTPKIQQTQKTQKVQKAQKAQKVQNGPGQGLAVSPSPQKAKRKPQKARLSRSKAAIAERAALKVGPPKPTVLTESQISRVRTRNNTSALFLGRTAKSWEEPVEHYPPRVMIEIPDDTVEEEQDEREAEEMRDEIDFEADFEDELTAALNAEFELQDRAAALDAAAEESEVSEEE